MELADTKKENGRIAFSSVVTWRRGQSIFHRLLAVAVVWNFSDVRSLSFNIVVIVGLFLSIRRSSSSSHKRTMTTIHAIWLFHRSCALCQWNSIDAFHRRWFASRQGTIDSFPTLSLSAVSRQHCIVLTSDGTSPSVKTHGDRLQKSSLIIFINLKSFTKASKRTISSIRFAAL